jgi:NAD(P)-dependent dehydrogenase (short-subunit alcohol dehydrogenase family)
MTIKDLHARYGEYALVTGASSGIGTEFAAQLAAAGLSLALVARRKDRLDALAGRLRAAHGTPTEVIELDLAGDGAVAELARRTGHLDIGLVVSSAGIVTTGPFLRNDLAAESALLRLNLMVPAQLAHVYGRLLARRGRDLQCLQDPADRGGTDPVAELEQLALDPLVPPAVVLGGEPPDQRGDLCANWRPARAARIGPSAGD